MIYRYPSVRFDWGIFMFYFSTLLNVIEILTKKKRIFWTVKYDFKKNCVHLQMDAII